jgi:anti-anti-sigma regulatory factor
VVTFGSYVFTLSHPAPLSAGGPEAGTKAVRAGGERCPSTDRALRLTLARAIALDNAGLVLDLSDVDFMVASPLKTIPGARELPLQHSASLTVQPLSAPPRRGINACSLSGLLGPGPEMAGNVTGKAVGSLVTV